MSWGRRRPTGLAAYYPDLAPGKKRNGSWYGLYQNVRQRGAGIPVWSDEERKWKNVEVRARRVGATSSGQPNRKTIQRRKKLIDVTRCQYYLYCAKAHAEDTRVMKAEERRKKAEMQQNEGVNEDNPTGPEPSQASDQRSPAGDQPSTACAAAEAQRADHDDDDEATRCVKGSLTRPRMRKRVCQISGDKVISEDVKARLAIIARGVVSDMPYPIRKVVAADPRIADRGIMYTRLVEREILRKYKAGIEEKRKDKLVLMQTAAELSLKGISSKAYCTLRGVLCKLGLRGVLPSVTALTETRNQLFKLSMADLQVFATNDGWFASPRAVVEMEILRLMQQVDDKTGRVVGIGPDGHGWQDHFHIKITLDARRITRRTSQTEVMLLIIPKGQEGVDCCQKAVSIRTIGIWMGKDSKANVQANMAQFYKQITSLEMDGVWYCPTEDTLLGIWEKYKDTTQEEQKERQLRKVGLTFWHGADMAAQCAVLGHGCAGHNYCGHCNAHKEERHIPYELHKVQTDINFQQLATSFDMFPKTLYAINAASLDSTDVLKLSEDGLRACTRVSNIPEQSAGCVAGAAKAQADVSRKANVVHASAADSDLIRTPRKRRIGGEPQARVAVPGVCQGPSALLKNLDGWKDVGHDDNCMCAKCKVPANTVVRVIPRPGFNRESDWLREHWTSYNHSRFTFCALHCLMRITEAMFQMITQQCLKNPHVIVRLNSGLTKAGISKQFKEASGHGGTHFYEKVTFEGHEALKLLAKDGTEGQLNIVSILQSMWPSGDVDDVGGTDYVKKQTALWVQWSEVVALMTQRNPATLMANNDGGSRFGKECREFCFRFQSMFHQDHCRSFYLHTLMHHAGDMMRELQNHGMCIGMMANSGAERRHEYGRRAAKKALAGGCWRNRCPELQLRQNIFAYLTLKEILIWQHGTDLVSHELARKAAGLHSESLLSRRDVGNQGEDELIKQGILALPSEKETEAALNDVADIGNEPPPLSGLLDTLDFVEGTETGVADESMREYLFKGGYMVEKDSELFKGRNDDAYSDASGEGSEDFEDAHVRMRDLEILRGEMLSNDDDAEDIDFDPQNGGSDEEGTNLVWYDGDDIENLNPHKRLRSNNLPSANHPQSDRKDHAQQRVWPSSLPARQRTEYISNLPALSTSRDPAASSDQPAAPAVPAVPEPILPLEPGYLHCS